MVAVLLQGALLLQGRKAVRVGDLPAEVELLLAHGAEVAGREVAERLQLGELVAASRFREKFVAATITPSKFSICWRSSFT